MDYRILLLAFIGVGSLLTISGCSQDSMQQAAVVHQESQSHVDWSGTVDNTATVYVQGAKAWVDNVTGKPVQNTVADFQGVVPSSDGATVDLTRESGRGDIEIVEQPTKSNNYTAAVRIMDPEPGSDQYKFELTW